MKKLHVLVVDDEKSIRELIAMRLEDSGFEVSSVEDGIKALEFLKEKKPDIIVLDKLMPGMDGYEVLLNIRADKATSHIPVVMLTAVLNQADKVKGLKMGLDDYMTKPYDAGEFIARIRAVLKRTAAKKRSRGPGIS
jgi:DNA-binding response OmpR family regulator